MISGKQLTNCSAPGSLHGDKTLILFHISQSEYILFLYILQHFPEIITYLASFENKGIFVVAISRQDEKDLATKLNSTWFKDAMTSTKERFLLLPIITPISGGFLKQAFHLCDSDDKNPIM